MRKIDPLKQQERRSHILAAAADCFAEQGFHSTSTAQICARAGMSPGNLFHYYGSKAEIIAEVRRHLWPLVSDGTVAPIIHAELPIAEAAAAHRLLESGEAFGKVTLHV